MAILETNDITGIYVFIGVLGSLITILLILVTCRILTSPGVFPRGGAKTGNYKIDNMLDFSHDVESYLGRLEVNKQDGPISY